MSLQSWGGQENRSLDFRVDPVWKNSKNTCLSSSGRESIWKKSFDKTIYLLLLGDGKKVIKLILIENIFVIRTLSIKQLFDLYWKPLAVNQNKNFKNWFEGKLQLETHRGHETKRLFFWCDLDMSVSNICCTIVRTNIVYKCILCWKYTRTQHNYNFDKSFFLFYKKSSNAFFIKRKSTILIKLILFVI